LPKNLATKLGLISRDKARVSFLHSCGPCQLFAVSLLLLTVLSFYARFVFDGEPPEMKKKELAKRYASNYFFAHIHY